jgi:hypothetical protein
MALLIIYHTAAGRRKLCVLGTVCWPAVRVETAAGPPRRRSANHAEAFYGGLMAADKFASLVSRPPICPSPTPPAAPLWSIDNARNVLLLDG